MRFRSPLLLSCAGQVSAGVLSVLFRTLRKKLCVPVGVNPYDACGSRRYLFSVWHDSTIMAAFGGRHARTVALTSCHRDGSFVASVLDQIGVGTVRGSTGRSGHNAARQLLRIADTHDIVITPDGPRGPQRTVSRGVVFLAARSGNPIVPTAFASSNCWTIRGSWTTQIIPKPFSKVVLLAGQPIVVPANVEPDAIETYRAQVQRAMDSLQDRADRLTFAANRPSGQRQRRVRPPFEPVRDLASGKSAVSPGTQGVSSTPCHRDSASVAELS